MFFYFVNLKARKLSDADLALYKLVFQQFDTNSDGFITKSEFQDVIKSFGVRIEEKDLGNSVNMNF